MVKRYSANAEHAWSLVRESANECKEELNEELQDCGIRCDRSRSAAAAPAAARGPSVKNIANGDTIFIYENGPEPRCPQ